ncbi:urea transporter, partial [bacterium]|nr:urea transporter [bacterium]
LNPNLALSGIISVVAAYLFARFIRMERNYLKFGYYTYNPLLVGLSIGYLFKINPLTIFFLITAGILTLMLTVMLSHLFWHYLRLPILSLPFVFVSSIAYLASLKYSNLFVTGLYAHSDFSCNLNLPFWLAGFFKSLGAILFLPYVIPGIALAILILLSSRILFMLAVAGYYLGTIITALLVGSSSQAFSNILHFNYILIAMAVGSIFLIPSLKSYGLALAAVCTSIIFLKSVEVFWSTYGIPGFTLPFNFISLSFIYALGLVQYPQIAKYIKATPEETLDFYISNIRRYRGHEKTLALPFFGSWNVWQGFNGQWTHQHSWKYAYDFIITDEKGKSHKSQGTALNDYYAFGKPVLSPTRGRVVKIINHLEDNPAGQVDKTNAWGNLVILRDEREFFVELSHFKKDSIEVKEGAWVERGAFLGLCGNSGYSPQPHIHIQAQETEEIGSFTIPFSFVSYTANQQYFANNLPDEKTLVAPVFTEKSLDIKTSFLLDNLYKYQVLKNDKIVDKIEMAVKIAADGTFYFDTGKGHLYFGKHEGTFYCYHLEGADRYLKTIFLALPRLPLAYRKGLQWKDVIPVGVITQGWRKGLVQFISSFYHRFAQVEASLTYQTENRIAGQISSNLMRFKKNTMVELDDYLGFKSFTVDNIKLMRITDETFRD